MIETTIVIWKCDGLDCDCEKHEHYGPESSNSLAVYQQPPGWEYGDGARHVYCEECVKKRASPSNRQCDYSGCESATGNDWDTRCGEHSWRTDGGRP